LFLFLHHAQQLVRLWLLFQLVFNIQMSSPSLSDLVRTLDTCGHRPIKFYALVRDDTVSAALPNRPQV
jgi:hypothetical protein